MAADNTVSDDNSAVRELLEQAGTAVRARDPHVPASFPAQIYGRTVPEDLLRYGAGDLATLAARAYALFEDRASGRPKIRCAVVTLTESGDRKATGVVEIVNDDMPFLLDSVMGELSERRLAVRLVAHPVIGDAAHGDSHHNRFFREKMGVAGLCLKSQALSFTAPEGPREIQAPDDVKWEKIRELFKTQDRPD